MFNLTADFSSTELSSVYKCTGRQFT